MPSPASTPAPGMYKFTVKSVDEAVTLIREKLGANARVVSVRSVEAGGLNKLFRAPRLEVIAQLEAPVPLERAPALAVVSAEPAVPVAPPAIEPAGSSRSGRGTLPAEPGLADLLRRSGLTETALGRLQSGAKW